MIIRFHESVQGVLGILKDAGLVVLKRQGQYVAYSRPPRKKPSEITSEQRKSQSVLGSASGDWEKRSVQQKKAWEAYAAAQCMPGKKGCIRRGVDFARSSDNMRKRMGLPPALEAPTQSPPRGPKSVELLPADDPAVFSFRIDHWYGDGDDYVVFVKTTALFPRRGKKPDPSDATSICGFDGQSYVALPASGGVVSFTNPHTRIPHGRSFAARFKICRVSDGLCASDAKTLFTRVVAEE